jgi:3-hydroxyacyl-CoA dehydrogenase
MSIPKSAANRGWPHSTAIIGAGTMGLGVAECFVAAGIQVRICDATPELAQEAQEQLVERARGHAEAGLLGEEVVDRVAAVEVADDIPAAVHEIDLVFEAVPEQLDLKKDVLEIGRASCRERVFQEV